MLKGGMTKSKAELVAGVATIIYARMNDVGAQETMDELKLILDDIKIISKRLDKNNYLPAYKEVLEVTTIIGTVADLSEAVGKHMCSQDASRTASKGSNLNDNENKDSDYA